MAQSLTTLLADAHGLLRYVPTPKRVRARLHGHPVADSTRAVLLWEPRRVVPSYAVPREDVAAALSDAPAAAASPGGTGPAGGPGADGERAALDPSVPFAVHTTPGRPLSVEAGGAVVEGAAFALGDPDLDGYVVLDFAPFDWFDEDQPLLGHPRDPLHRIDVCPSGRTVRIEHEGTVLAETDEARWLFEGTFPMPRYYLPRRALRVPLVPGTLRTTCAYKGRASHWTVEAPGLRLPDIAWSYEDPAHDAEPVRGLVSFYTERLDVFIDGEPVRRPRTPWSRPAGQA
ncbi:DUF427 domain-containing protein [Citricoccus sp. SGAir0253]|uniref:DUF427 domain-containing protein n=1 Tax=Citricoccus sp. SGAir0253 TaxID=2567881 RepID=UPI0010CD2945|nr:DUF427 domain-containing protein [Citricoccus sp. SGAir0253]QCU78873.1 DUF427 domain-containing protein [Citricoccus sp. SGAir0253]